MKIKFDILEIALVTPFRRIRIEQHQRYDAITLVRVRDKTKVVKILTS